MNTMGWGEVLDESVIFTSQTLYSRRISPLYTLDRRVSGPLDAVVKTSLLFSGIQPRSFSL
jgi:hypothetical protein